MTRDVRRWGVAAGLLWGLAAVLLLLVGGEASLVAGLCVPIVVFAATLPMQAPVWLGTRWAASAAAVTTIVGWGVVLAYAALVL